MVVFALTVPRGAAGQEAGSAFADTIDVIAIDTVRVGARADDLTGIAASASEGRVGAVDLAARPIARDGELMETVPGMIVTQHSGEGKANQFFVRGFNLDHGTDFRTEVEGMPVNLPTHGHGQGYTDLNFLIREFVDLLEYRLGPHHTELGDFSSAGGAQVHLARRLERPFAQLTLGQSGFQRMVNGASSQIGGVTALTGVEAKIYDGPWIQPQSLRKLNGIARLSGSQGDNRWSVLALGYGSRWDATDQIPRRAVANRSIDRFGNVDPSAGGEASRFSLSASWSGLSGRTSRGAGLFVIRSDLDLFSNFTYFLDNPVSGDQFRQQDERWILGGHARYLRELDVGGGVQALAFGLNQRTDLIGNVALSRAVDRTPLGTIRRDEVTETVTGVFAEIESRWSARLRTVVGLRGDLFTFDVRSDLPANSGTANQLVLSPKGSVVLAATDALEFYLSGGLGFHSNDARGTTITVDPVSGDRAESVDPVVRSRGGEVGLRYAPAPILHSTLSGWALRLDSELLFVGDAGGTEATGASTRIGATWATLLRPSPDWLADLDISLAQARLDDEPDGNDLIPGAIERVVSSGLAWVPDRGAFASVRVRHFGAYPLVEDNSVRSDAVTLWNAEVGYRPGARARVEVALLNLFDSRASDIEYFYPSRLQGEPAAGVEDVHFHPAEPRQLRLTLRMDF